jgi:hypothetical protein
MHIAKLIITIIALAVAITSARAGLIDVTPGGTTDSSQYLQIFDKEARHQIELFDSATASGWAHIRGVLNGGTLFDTDLPQVSPAPAAALTWDFGNTGYSIRWLTVEGTGPGGEPWLNIYRFVGPAFQNTGTATLTLHDSLSIGQIAVYGSTPNTVPDAGSALGLMLCGLGACAVFNRARNERT